MCGNLGPVSPICGVSISSYYNAMCFFFVPVKNGSKIWTVDEVIESIWLLTYRAQLRWQSFGYGTNASLRKSFMWRIYGLGSTQTTLS